MARRRSLDDLAMMPWEKLPKGVKKKILGKEYGTSSRTIHGATISADESFSKTWNEVSPKARRWGLGRWL